jgi:hypothetical protein
MLRNCGTTLNGIQVTTLDCVFRLVPTLISWALEFAGTVALILIIISGITLITSGGDAKKVEQAKKTLTYAIAGLVLIFLSFFILIFISRTTGVACLDPHRTLSFTTCN